MIKLTQTDYNVYDVSTVAYGYNGYTDYRGFLTKQGNLFTFNCPNNEAGWSHCTFKANSFLQAKVTVRHILEGTDNLVTIHSAGCLSKGTKGYEGSKVFGFGLVNSVYIGGKKVCRITTDCDTGEWFYTNLGSDHNETLIGASYLEALEYVSDKYYTKDPENLVDVITSGQSEMVHVDYDFNEDDFQI